MNWGKGEKKKYLLVSKFDFTLKLLNYILLPSLKIMLIFIYPLKLLIYIFLFLKFWQYILPLSVRDPGFVPAIWAD